MALAQYREAVAVLVVAPPSPCAGESTIYPSRSSLEHAVFDIIIGLSYVSILAVGRPEAGAAQGGTAPFSIYGYRISFVLFIRRAA